MVEKAKPSAPPVLEEVTCAESDLQCLVFGGNDSDPVE